MGSCIAACLSRGRRWRQSLFDDDAMRGPGGSSRLRFSDSGTCSERDPRHNLPPHELLNNAPNTGTHVQPVAVIAVQTTSNFAPLGQGGAGPAGDSFGGNVPSGSPVPRGRKVQPDRPPRSRGDMATTILHI